MDDDRSKIYLCSPWYVFNEMNIHEPGSTWSHVTVESISHHHPLRSDYSTVINRNRDVNIFFSDLVNFWMRQRKKIWVSSKHFTSVYLEMTFLTSVDLHRSKSTSRFLLLNLLTFLVHNLSRLPSKFSSKLMITICYYF